MANAEEMVNRFIEGYSGMFGKFKMKDGSDEQSASAVKPEGRNESVVRYDICDDIDGAFAKRKKFIDSKRRRLVPMGKLAQFDTKSIADDSYGGILNYKLMGRTGGFFFYAARKGNVLVFVQAYSTEGEKQISDEERDSIIGCALKCTE